MEKAIFIAKILGPLYLLVSLSFLTRGKDFMKIYHEAVKSPAFMYISALLSLLMGLLIVNSYNVWAANWTVIVTIMGWAALLKGLMLLFVPEMGLKWGDSILKNKSYFTAALAVTAVLGAYLTYMAYAVV